MGRRDKAVTGEIPESGAIFMSNSRTKKECLERKLFGLPSGFSNFVLHVKKGMTLFLFEFEQRLLYGVFRATCDGELNIEPKAFRSSGKHFPAQVRFTTVSGCSPLAEHEFKDVIRSNYYSGKKFHFGLNEKQVSKLMKLFRSKSISKNNPERNIWRYDGDDKPAEGGARFGDLRKDIRHRLRFEIPEFSGDEVKEVDENAYSNKHTIETSHKNEREGFLAPYMDEREGFLAPYTTDAGDFGDYNRHDILEKHLDLREKHVDEIYVPQFVKPHGNHLDEFAVGSSDFLIDSENKDIIDYKRLQDEYIIREGVRQRLKERKEHALTNHVQYSHTNQNVHLDFDPTRISVSDIPLSPPCFDNGPGFIPIDSNHLFYPCPENTTMSKSLHYYPHSEGSIQYLDDPGPQRSVYPEFISRKLSSSDGAAALCAREAVPTGKNERFSEEHKDKHIVRTSNKRASVFSRLTSKEKREEQDFSTDEKHELNASVDKVMEMLEKAVSSPIKRTEKASSVIKQDAAADDDNFLDRGIDDYESLDANPEGDANGAYEEVEGDLLLQETRLVDFKRRKKSDKRIDDVLVGVTSDAGPVENDGFMGMPPRKRRKLVRPAFLEENVTTDVVSAPENAPEQANVLAEVAVEYSETVDGGNLTKTRTESSKKVNASIKQIDLNMLPTSDESSSFKDDDYNSTKAPSAGPESLAVNKLPTSDGKPLCTNETNLSKVDASVEPGQASTAECQKRVVLDVFVKGPGPTPVTSSKDEQKMCGWIDW